MPVPKRRHCPSRRNKRRGAHKKLSAPALSECPKCHQPKPPHRVCPHCGSYNNRDYKVLVTE